MRTSLNEIKEIEAYLDNQLSLGDRLFFEARMIVNRTLRQNVALQKKTCAVIRHHYRLMLKNNFNIMHNSLFDHPSHAVLKEEINRLFKS
jgi:hypothetical protein